MMEHELLWAMERSHALRAKMIMVMMIFMEMKQQKIMTLKVPQ
jgi:hypothetical protein